MADDRSRKELLDDLRASREVIEVLQRRIEGEHRRSDTPEAPAQRAIATLERTVDRRTRALLESEARYRALFDHSPYIVLTVDSAGQVAGANATAFERLSHLDQLLDLEVRELFAEASRERVDAMLRLPRAEAHELPLADGRIVDVNVAKLPGFPRSQVLIRDVSRRVALAQELQHSRRLAAIGHLAAGVAHEINNPLTVLQLGLVELQAGLDDAALTEVADFVAHCDRIANIVSNLHAFAEPRPPCSETLLVRDLLSDAKNEARAGLGTIGLMISLEHRELSVVADRRQIVQVLVNLLGNAARAMGGEGHVSVSAESRGEEVLITISDEGPGIEEERLHQIFTPFVGREPAAGSSLGSGLVLSMSWGLLQENRGRLRAINRPEGGASFEIALPGATSSREAPQQVTSDGDAPEPSPKLVSMRILCVEDEEVLQRTLLRLLQLAGHHPTGVSSAEEGLERLRDEDFDVLISDLRLPKMSGDVFAEQVREAYPHLEGRILLMSGFFRDAETNPHFLQKPFTARQLSAALTRLVESSSST
jgi:PAS domain S-box-containing protein